MAYDPYKRLDYQKKYRAEHKAPPKERKERKPKKSGRHKTFFDDGHFVAIDGEGGMYEGKHRYQLLGASGEDSYYNVNGLSTKQCFEYLIDLKLNNPMGIFVIFAGGYDGNFWLRDLPKDKIEEICKAEDKYPIEWNGYRIKFIQRRKFELWSPRLKSPMVIWDIWSFFQGSFIQALKTWLPNHHLTELIIEGKKRRTDFTSNDVDFMVKYNDAENEALVLIMDKLRDAIREMGLKLSTWFGAGSIASAIYKKVDIKQFFPTTEPPSAVIDARSRAYFGGRIEIGKFGTHAATIHHYDINSAYPAAMADLPNMSGGEWIHAGKCDPRKIKHVLVISEIKFDYTRESAFYPLPIRSEAMGMILFPRAGHGWYWKPETIEALNFSDGVEILDCYYFVPADDQKPFAFVPEYYALRQMLVAESKRTGVPNGVEKGIKLGLNSLYGKLAQRVGYDEKKGILPPYHNLEWAGHITSATRAKLFSAANQKPYSIVCLATDGVYSTESLELDCPKEKVLGGWEYQTHEAMTLVMSGIYFLHDDDGTVTYYARGFDKISEHKEILAFEQMVQAAWKKGIDKVLLPCTRLITMKAALVGGVWWERWLSWYEFKTKDGKPGRTLTITPASKRWPVKENFKPAYKSMLQTEPAYNLFPEIMSAKHDLPWEKLFEPDEEDIAFDLTEEED